ncbi:MAG: RelA/SpoT domain-containing protein [Phycisphaerales bacterium]|nr:RelA/SpoT domain-containing protein [Planctomycetota bacterium]MCH8507564.1 RelA/SpoT domain-containing protein [Phycisphaerales bacterium]
MQNALRRYSTRVYESATIAQRIKRSPSIISKLKRMPTFNLSQIQDIGGCRAVVRDINEVRRVHEEIRSSDIRHNLKAIVDHIDRPKRSGYRSLHLVYRYFSDKNTDYNGLLIELQIRSRIQHAWATAVEAAGLVYNCDFKAGMGDKSWLRFFALASSVLALKENTPRIPYTPRSDSELVRRTVALERKLSAFNALSHYNEAFRLVNSSANHGKGYYVLEFNRLESSLLLSWYGEKDIEDATNHYMESERRFYLNGYGETVLVASKSLASLQRAYPNYFLDTKLFVSKLREALA